MTAVGKEIMILSLSHSFIFVHVPKTAGSSITMMLSAYGRDYQRSIWRSISRRSPFKEKPENAHFRIHAPADSIARKLSRPVYDSFNSFAVVRNPFDHAVSHFEYMKQYRSKRVAENFAKMNFEEYLAERMKKPSLMVPFFARLPDQSYFLASNTGEMLVKTLIKFENLDAEMDAFADKVTLPKLDLQRVNFTTSRSKKRPYQSYFNTTTQEMVLKLYDRDFDNFGYVRKLSSVPS